MSQPRTKYGYELRRKERFKGSWTNAEIYKDVMVRSLDSGGLPKGPRIEMVAAGGREGKSDFKDESDHWRVMYVTHSYIYGNGATSFVGFVTDDAEKWSDSYHLEEWEVLDPNGEFS